MASIQAFSVGVQPCDDFTPAMENPWGHGEHECFAREDGSGTLCAEANNGIVSFCTNCHTDHHAGGYDTCIRPLTKAYPNVAPKETPHA